MTTFCFTVSSSVVHLDVFLVISYMRTHVVDTPLHQAIDCSRRNHTLQFTHMSHRSLLVVLWKTLRKCVSSTNGRLWPVRFWPKLVVSGLAIFGQCQFGPIHVRTIHFWLILPLANVVSVCVRGTLLPTGPSPAPDPLFPLPPQLSFFLPSLGGLFLEFWWCLKRWALKCARLEFSGLSCEDPPFPSEPEVPFFSGFGHKKKKPFLSCPGFHFCLCPMFFCPVCHFLLRPTFFVLSQRLVLILSRFRFFFVPVPCRTVSVVPQSSRGVGSCHLWLLPW